MFLIQIYDNDFFMDIIMIVVDDKLKNNWSGFSAQAIVLRMAKHSQCAFFPNDLFFYAWLILSEMSYLWKQ